MTPAPIKLPAGVVSQGDDERVKALGTLLDNNQKQHALLYDGVTHNHLQHILSAAYQLGATAEHLEKIYAAQDKVLIKWEDRPSGRVDSESDLDSHLGDRSYEKDFVDFFRQELRVKADPGVVLDYYLLRRGHPLFTSLVSGFGHPWILLADAVELGDAALAMDALALTAADYDPLHKLLSFPNVNSGSTKHSTQELLEEVRGDASLNGLIIKPGITNMRTLLTNGTAVSELQKYLLRQNVGGDPDETLKELVDMAVNLLCCTHVPGQPAFDFYLNHSLTFSNCVHIMQPVFRHAQATLLFRMAWLMTLLAYVTQGRPVITPSLLQGVESVKTWQEIKQDTLYGGQERTYDPHYVKAVHILATFAELWPDEDAKLLKAANKLNAEFHSWTGFGIVDEVRMNTEFAQ